MHNTEYRPRPSPCSTCGDTVLIAEDKPRKMLGWRVDTKTTVRLEHADPSPDGEVFDGVDDDCRRARVR